MRGRELREAVGEGERWGGVSRGRDEDRVKRERKDGRAERRM